MKLLHSVVLLVIITSSVELDWLFLAYCRLFSPHHLLWEAKHLPWRHWLVWSGLLCSLNFKPIGNSAESAISALCDSVWTYPLRIYAYPAKTHILRKSCGFHLLETWGAWKHNLQAFWHSLTHTPTFLPASGTDWGVQSPLRPVWLLTRDTQGVWPQRNSSPPAADMNKRWKCSEKHPVLPMKSQMAHMSLCFHWSFILFTWDCWKIKHRGYSSLYSVTPGERQLPQISFLLNLTALISPGFRKKHGPQLRPVTWNRDLHLVTLV